MSDTTTASDDTVSGPFRRLAPTDPRAAYADTQIQKLRQRLLDLTNRNRLLNYVFTDRARGQVRVIDELPDQLYARLQAGQGMWFRSLRDPSGESADEKSDEFVAACDVARLQDDAYLLALQEIGEEDPENPKFLRLERELKDRVRIRLGLPPRPTRKTMSRAEVAREQKLDPTYDLPVSSPDGPQAEKHDDNEIQSLLFPDEMERKLSFLRDQTRKGHEETGLNTLFAAYGFLEWYESDDSDRKLVAPLIMQPLDISREKKGHSYRYAVKGSGEPALVNLSLVERMKEFALAIPDFAEGDTAEDYFARVSVAVAGKSRWRVRRYIVVGTFSFGKLVMWHDLDPARWPLTMGLPTHPVVASLMGGTGKPAGDDAEPYNVDTEEIEKRLPLLVTDADASQLCTIIDAIGGKSLAVKGPPGTGKSQTITNLVAAALATGKRVLFVAEKMAALEVVKKRLDHFGLGDFVLELHSTKARKEKLLSAIGSRLELPRLPAPTQLAGAQDEVRRLKRQLAAYVDLLNTPVGRTGKTLQEVFWAEARTRETQLPAALDNVVLENADTMSAQDFERGRALLCRLEAVRSEITASGESLSTHPWRGIRNLVPVFQHDSLVESARLWGEAILNAERHSRELSKRLEADDNRYPEQIATLVSRIRELPRPEHIPADAKSANLMALLEDSRHETVARKLDAKWSRESEIAKSLQKAFRDTASLLKDATALDALGSMTSACLRDATNSAALLARLEQAREQLARWDVLAATLQRLARLVNLTELNQKSDLLLVRRAIDLARGVSAATLHRRRPNLLDGNGAEILNAIRRRAEELRAQAVTLAADMQLDGSISPSDARKAATTLRTAGFFARLFSPTFNAARCLYEDVALHHSSDWKLAATHLDSLAIYLDATQSFTQDSRNAQHLGEWFQGIETEFDPLEEAFRFGVAALEIGRQGGSGPALRRFLLESSPQSIFDFCEGASGEDSELLAESIQYLSDQTPASVAGVTGQLREQISRWETALGAASELSLSTDFPFAEIPGLALLAQEYRRVSETEVPDDTGVAPRLVSLGFTPDAPAVRATILDLATRLSLPESIKAKAWRRTVFCASIATALDELHALAAAVESSFQALDRAWIGFNSLAAFDSQATLGVPRPLLSPFGSLRTWVESALSARHLLPGWIAWLRVLADVRDEGLTEILDAYANETTVYKLDIAFDRVVWRSLAKKAFEKNEDLARFTGLRQEDAQRRFRELDRKILELNRYQLRATLTAARAPAGIQSGGRNEWTDMALLAHHSSLQRPRIPIRKLIRGAHNALQCIKPCWMMSPGSIAQFLPQGLVEFDLVVIDEASQLKPEDAIGAAARGQQIVVVGDPMQLPPTSFFDRADDGLDEDEDDVEAESVLDLALSVYRPARNLRWHYRSRHESLVAFSNKEFYDRSLIVFPSPHDANDELGVKYHHVAGRYQGRGGNQDEVQAVATAALRHMRTQPHLSLGVVAVNREQAELLRREIERLILHDDAAQSYVANWEETMESLFVKNLETVQGDERDVIMISMVYGPNEQGVMHQRFGPINSNVGHRRLNVLFTRAKHRVELFTSMTAADVQPSDTSKWGVSAMKRYLEYAATGQLESGDEGGSEPDSDFEVFVADALKQHGYEVRTQVGVAGFRIDLGVRHSSYPHGYLLGIECDGATYHSAKSARDRDALRQEILEQLGWRLYRIWSTDWFNDPRGETDKLVRHLRQLVETRARLSVSPSI